MKKNDEFTGFEFLDSTKEDVMCAVATVAWIVLSVFVYAIFG